MTFSSFNHWPKIAAQLVPGAKVVTTHTAQAIERAAAAGAPVATGFLQGSVYSVTPNAGSTYSPGNPPGDSYAFAPAAPDSDTGAVAGVAANYGEWVELGHHVKQTGTWVPAQPLFFPGVEVGRQVLDAEMALFGRGLGASIT